MHSCYSCTLVTHANCHMFYYCFSFHTSPLFKFLPFVLSAYQHSTCCILFPVRTSLLLSTYVYDALSLYFFYTCVLFVLCTLLASCMLVQPCTLIVPCTLLPTSTLCALVIHSTLATSSSPVASASWWLYSGHTPFCSWSTLLYASSDHL